jgi:NitT/TauT family transport system substrate-binding protein
LGRHSATVFIGALSALLLAGCGVSTPTNGEASAATDEGSFSDVKVGLLPIVDVAPIYLGVEEGFFEDEGIDLEIVTAQGGAAIVPSVLTGDFQFGFSNVTSLLLAADKGIGIDVAAAGAYTTGEKGNDCCAVVVSEDSDIAVAADLAGRTVSVNTLNNLGDTTVRHAVERAGGNPSEVKFVEIGFPDAPAALASGQVDAAWLAEPALSMALSQGAVPISWTNVEVDPDLMVSVYFTSDELAAENPQLVEDFTRAMNRSLEYAAENPDAARAIINTYIQIPEATVNELRLPRWAPEINTESLSLLGDLAQKDGLLTNPVDVNYLVD